MVFAQQPNQEQVDLANAMGPPPQAPKKKGLFGGGISFDLSSHKKPLEGQTGETNALSQEVNAISRRLRMLEDRTQNMRDKMQILDQNMLENNKKLLAEVKTNNDDIREIKQNMSEIQNKILLLIKELRLSAKKEDVDVMMKYTELWQPQNFVTREQVEKIAREIFEEYTHQNM
ncbi:hypothetical protein J4410_02160 [Candidatus Woesearchaeota archaeon]|nr:hypothetical protein [Candidatus Woesearchaeota archaeon]